MKLSQGANHGDMRNPEHLLEINDSNLVAFCAYIVNRLDVVLCQFRGVLTSNSSVYIIGIRGIRFHENVFLNDLLLIDNPLNVAKAT